MFYEDNDVGDITLGELKRILIGGKMKKVVGTSQDQESVIYQGFPSFVFEQDDMAEKSVPVQVFEKKSLPLIREQPNKCLGLHSSFQQAYARVRTGNLLPHDIWVFAKALVFSVVVPTFLTNKTNRVAGFRTIVLLALIMCEFAGWDPPRHAV